MRVRIRPALVAWTACGLSATFASARLALAIVDPDSAGTAVDGRVPGGGIPLALVELVVLVAFAVIGAVVATRQPRNAVGWFLCATPALLGLGLLGERWYWHQVLDGSGSSDSARLAIWLSTWTWVPAMVPLFTFVPLLFPSGSPPTRRWRKVGWAAGAALSALVLALAFGAGALDEHPGVSNPLGLEFVDRDVLGAIGFPLLIFGAIGSAASLVVRFRRSHGIEREQLKWVATAAALLVVVWLSNVLFDAQVDDDTSWAIFLVALLWVAGSVAIAMLRYRLYDIDVVINRALVYAVLTATLAAAYLASVLLLQLALERRDLGQRARSSGIDAGGGGAVQAGAGADPGGGGPALLPPPLRRGSGRSKRSPDGLRDQVELGVAERGAARGRSRDAAAGSRVAVAAGGGGDERSHGRPPRPRPRRAGGAAVRHWRRPVRRRRRLREQSPLLARVPGRLLGAGRSSSTSRHPRNAIGWIFCGCAVLQRPRDPGRRVRELLARRPRRGGAREGGRGLRDRRLVRWS